MQGKKATTESWEPKDLNNSSIARSDQQKDSQTVATRYTEHMGATHSSQYTVPDANNQLHLLLPTHEMWELPTPLIAANRPSREMRYGSYPLSLRGIRELSARPRTQHPDYTREMSSHTSPASSKRPKAISKRSVSAIGVQRYHSHSHQNCLSPAIEEDKTKSSLKSQSCSQLLEQYPPHLIYATVIPTCTTDLATDLALSQNRSLLTQMTSQRTTVATGHVTRYSLLHNQPTSVDNATTDLSHS
ncbi:protein IQ-DOMAIN 1-like [Dorcoceras hygrometricum]|uniref:Protein IQ-DOMAIN 1-like n=1 Tax=Dorcoceras hygrometricum TaxID=472368 RepID=A0A2Z7BQC0_9LAMI|nr:protein IQ-DOMAIN 1-like [Dorcoceras hygrometricum]